MANDSENQRREVEKAASKVLELEKQIAREGRAVKDSTLIERQEAYQAYVKTRSINTPTKDKK